MPRQVLDSPTPLESVEPPRALRERQNRVEGDAGAFGLLLGAMHAIQDGGAGIVRGEIRDDSAAEWNAREAHQARQEPRSQQAGNAPEARESPNKSQERIQARALPSASPNATVLAKGESLEPSTKNLATAADSRPSDPTLPGKPADATHHHPVATPATATLRQALTHAAGIPANMVPTASASRGGQSSTSIDASRGPPGGVARGKSLAPGPNNAERMQRFERVFQAQLGRGLAQALRSGDGTVTLRLRPESLGQLTVRVEVTGQRVHALFETRSVEAQQMLERSRDVLRHQLESRGLHADRIEVRLMEEPAQVGTRLANAFDGGASVGQDGRAYADSQGGRGWPDGQGASHRAWRGAPREEDELAAGAEPWRALGTLGLDAIA